MKRTLSRGRMRLLGLCAAVLLLSVPAARAQGNVNDITRPGVPSMTLYVWQPQSSGIWQVEHDVSVIELLSAVGVTAGDASTGANSQLTVYRRENGDRRLVFQGKIRDILASEVQVPALQDQDVLLVEAVQRRGFSATAISTYITTASTLLLLILNLRSL